MDNLAYREEPWDELINGRVVLMSPRPAVNHNRTASNIYRIFADYLDGKTCEAFADGTDLYLSDHERFVPDGMIVCDETKIKADGVHGAPDLIVEVLSPRSARFDRGHKKNVYEAAGVPEYWIVDPANRTVEVYLLEDGQYVFHDAYSILPDDVLEKLTSEERAAVITEFSCSLFDDLVIRLQDVFRRIV